MGHETKCAHMHGHNYKVELHARQQKNRLDQLGRVVDFSVLKEKLGAWIDEHWDHGFILHERDQAAIAGLNIFSRQADVELRGGHTKMFLMPYNPTAENIARFLVETVGPKALEETGVELCKVVVHETYSCSATFELESLLE